MLLLLLLLGGAAAAGGGGSSRDWRNVDGVNMVNAVGSSLLPASSSSSEFAADASAAFAMAAMLGDRLSVQGGIKAGPKRLPAVQVLLNCAEMQAGRSRLESFLDFMSPPNVGVPDVTCMGYRGEREKCSPVHICVNCFGFCSPVEHYDTISIVEGSKKRLMNVEEIEKEVAANGPVACMFKLNGNVDASLKPLELEFFGEIVGFNAKQQWIVNPSLGTANGNDPTYPGIYLIPTEAVEIKECFAAVPVLRRRTGTTPVIRNGGEMKFESHAPPVISTVFSEDVNEALRKFPTTLDWRFTEDGYSALTPIRSHHIGPTYCGACWAMASTSTFSDRIKLARGPKLAEDVLISAQTIVDCARTWHSHGCFGGAASDSFQWFLMEGATDESCYPFISRIEGCAYPEKACTSCSTGSRSHCFPVEPRHRFFASEHGRVSGMVEMMEEIQRGGPIECEMATGRLFDEYDGKSILCDPTEHTDINHDVEIIGWGEDEITGQKYWIGRNSWGTSWGDSGFFKLCRGVNNMKVESNCAWVKPKIVHPTNDEHVSAISI